MTRTEFTCEQCGSHDLFARPIVHVDTRNDPPVHLPGEWILACRNGHRFDGEAGTAIQITGENR